MASPEKYVVQDIDLLGGGGAGLLPGSSASPLETEGWQQQQQQSSAASARRHIASAVAKEGMRSADLGHMARAITFHQHFGDGQQLSKLNADVQALAQGTRFDEIDKFVAVTGGPASASTQPDKATAESAAKKFIDSTTSRAWIPTLFAVKGRASPTCPMILTCLMAVAVTVIEIEVLTKERVGTVACADDDSKLCKRYSLVAPYTTVAVVGGALFFLMVFRTNASYDRWWEGRKKWGMIINRTRDFVRQSCTFIQEPLLTDQMTRWT
jgi:hypothetical protein